MRVLIVEDEVLYALLLKRELKKGGIEVCSSVTTGEDALLAFKEHQPEVVLMDIRLAGDMDGIETAEKLKLQGSVKIIFMTGYALDEIRERAMKVGPLAFLEKPVKAENIRTFLN